MKYANLPANKAVGQYQWNHQALLGQGAYGKVYLAKDTKSADQKFVAVKQMENSDFKDPFLIKALQNEIEILSSLKGLHTIGLIEQLKTTSRTYLVQKFCNGGDVRSYLTKNGAISEKQALKIFKDILLGFQELYQNKLIHRDLKPENFLIDNNLFIVADYGFTTKVQDYENSKLTESVGTPLYMSPQILQNQPYTTKSDVWSMGVIFYEILYGKTPFPANSMEQLIQNTLRMPVKFPYDVQVSESTKSLLKGMLVKDEKARLSWAEVFKHPIFTSQIEVQENKQQVAQLDAEYKVLISQIQQVIQQQNVDVSALFQQHSQGKHDLTLQQFGQLLKQFKPDVSQDSLNGLFKKIDKSGDGLISKDEFENILCYNDYTNQSQVQDNNMLIELRAKKVLNKLQGIVREHHLDIARIYQKFDKNADGQLNINELEAILKVIDDQITRPEVEQLFKQYDQDRSGIMNFKEFTNLLVGDKQVQQVAVQLQNIKLSDHATVALNKLKTIIHQNELDLNMIFVNFDKDKSGTLSLQEFVQMIRVVDNSIDANDINEIFKSFDSDNGGNIGIEEFKKSLN